jgi:glycosyltransferase involved in cell wall biosynthesis
VTPAGKEKPRGVRLLVITSDTYPPTRVDVSVLFGEELASRGHRFDWIMQSAAPCTRAYVATWGGGRVFVGRTDSGTSLLSRIRKHWYSVTHDMQVFSRMRGGDYDAIEVKDKFLSALPAIVAARLYRKPMLFWLSYPFPEDYLHRSRDRAEHYRYLYWFRGWAFWLLLYKLILPRAEHVFVQSEQMLRDVAARGIPAIKLTAVPMGVRLPPSTEEEDEQTVERATAEPQRVLYLGSLARARRIDFLLRVLALVRVSLPEVTLCLVGSGNSLEDEQFLRQEVDRLRLGSSVEFRGQLPQQAAMRLVREADVCVSALEPSPVFDCASPTKLVEYMLMGRPVVANDQPEQRWLIEQSGGGLCVPYREDAFADALIQLLRQPDMARAMGERGRRFVVRSRNYTAIADVVEAQLLRLQRGSRTGSVATP